MEVSFFPPPQIKIFPFSQQILTLFLLFLVLHCNSLEQAADRCHKSSPLISSLAVTAINMASLKGDAIPTTTKQHQQQADKQHVVESAEKEASSLFYIPSHQSTPLKPPCWQG